MPALSYRTKLVLAMSLVVAAVTGSTIFVTERQVQTGYQRLFEEQFHHQTQAFAEHRARQLQELSTLCKTTAEKVRVVSAMEEALASNDPDLLYDNLDVEGLSLINRQAEVAAAEQSVSTSQVSADETDGATAMVVDASGHPLVPTKPRSYFPTFLDVQQGKPVALFKKRLTTADLQRQEIGYLAVKQARPKSGSSGDFHLREFIITPLIIEPTNELLGAIVVSYPVSDLTSQTLPEGMQELMSGIWLDGQIYGPAMPSSLHPSINSRVSSMMRHLPQSTGPHSDLNPLYDGKKPHRLFIKEIPHNPLFPAAAQVGLYSLDEAMKEQRGLRLVILGFGLFALVVGIGFVMLISHGFSKPIEQLVQGTNRVRQGDFETPVEVKTRDELGTLAASFNEMTKDLALKERYRAVLSQVTDREVASQMISGQIRLGGEIRSCSVVFCDIRGFTSLTENMPPAEVIALLNEHMTALNRVVHKHHGVVDKFVGDLIMAIFGAPMSYGHDALNAARCALEMLQVRTALNETSTHRIEMGIGLATGEMLAGCMGSADRLNYTVLGERVNLASRLCSSAGRMELLIDRNTYDALPPDTIVEPTAPLELKGFSDPIPAYRLLALPAPQPIPAPV